MKLLVMATNNLYKDEERIEQLYDYALANGITDIYILSHKIIRLTDEMISEKNLLSAFKYIPEKGIRTHLFLGVDDSMMFSVNAFRRALAERKNIELLVDERYALEAAGRKIYLVNKQYDEAAFKDDEWMDFKQSVVIYRSEELEWENWKKITIGRLSYLSKDNVCLELDMNDNGVEWIQLSFKDGNIEKEYLFRDQKQERML